MVHGCREEVEGEVGAEALELGNGMWDDVKASLGKSEGVYDGIWAESWL